ncbi:MAG: imidazole glycerol phosphate synthase subunit HisH [Proteobacteria bacterium]|nr:imidazole glycerol phosphate synthase subunit HisH [Pseudomonadota bacterium]
MVPDAPLVVQVVRTGVANIASVLAGLRRLGAEPTLTEDPRAVAEARAVVLPGVGAFGAGMERLREAKLEGVLRERVAAGQPTLAVCLGLQLLCEGSEESPGVAGLGVLPSTVRRFSPAAQGPQPVRVPQLGWNEVLPQAEDGLLERGFAYFANSYRLDSAPPGWAWARSEHGGPFVAALERGAVLACQFHPELSGPWGAALLGRWLARASATR